MKQVVQITITVGETGGDDRLHVTTNAQYHYSNAGLTAAFLDACSYLSNYGNDRQKLCDMFDDNVVLVDRKQVTAPNKKAAIARLDDEYARDQPLTFTPDKNKIQADYTKGTVNGPATWEDKQNIGHSEPLKYDFIFKYTANTWIMTFIHSKP